MDPISQGVLGAVFAQTRSQKKDLGKAAVIGALAAMTPDLDVLIKSSIDPLLALDYHRHFTHSLFFIPFGALLCSLVLYPLFGRRWGVSFWQTLTWATIGYATHALLDACTSYGTLLLWPFSNYRVAWDIVSIIDPLFTIPLIIFAVMASIQQRSRLAVCAVSWVFVYLGIGVIQHERAIDVGRELAASRGHEVIRLEVKPSFANLVVWKSIYETPDRFYVDGVRPGFGQDKIWEGESIAKLNAARDFPWLDADTQQAKDIERFRWFSADYLALDPLNSQRIVDIRYSMLPNEITPIWGIELSALAHPEQHIVYTVTRKSSEDVLDEFLAMIFD